MTGEQRPDRACACAILTSVAARAGPSGGLHRWLAVVVAVVVLAPVLGSLPVAPAAAVARAVVGAPCDVDGDGVVEEVVSSGADGAAQDLAEDAGVLLAPARAAHRWRVQVCVEVVDDGDPATEDRRVRALGPAVEELKPEAAGWERSALEKALTSIRPQYFRPGAWTSPHVAGVQSTTLHPGTNAGRQVRYLDDWALANPGGPRPTFDLWISNEDSISAGFARELTVASERVDITINGQPWSP